MQHMMVIALGARGESMSGGDRLFIEFCRRWSKKVKITILVNEEGKAMCRRNNLKNINYKVINIKFLRKFGFWPHYIASIIMGIIYSIKTKIKPDILYSASDFWMDLFPSLIIKKRKKSKLVAGYYLVAPNPFKGFKGGIKPNGLTIPRIKDLLYFFSQMISKRLLKYCDGVFVTNDSVKENAAKYTNSPIFVTKGGIDNSITKQVSTQQKLFDCVFIGRLHEQKGVIELIDIWNEICHIKPNAKLAIIGTGPLEEKMKKKVKKYNLENNTEFFGFLDGIDKIKIFKQSRIVLHTEIYGIGSMAPIEAMACGLPGVCFNLPDFKNYYLEGMLFSENQKTFVKNIINLLENKRLYYQKSSEAKKLAEFYDWALLTKKALIFIYKLNF